MNMISRFFLVAVIFSVILCAAPALSARQLVLAFDVSPSMGIQCAFPGQNGLKAAKQRARDLLDRELTRDPESRCTIIVFTDTVASTRIAESNNRKDLFASLKTLQIDESAGSSVANGLEAALDLLRQHVDSKQEAQTVVIFTAADAEHGTGLLASLAKADMLQTVVRLQIFVNSDEIAETVQTEKSTEKITLSTFGCPGEKKITPHEQKTFFTVRAITAEQLGVSINDVTINSDLLTDLHMDPYSAYDLLAILCDEYKRPLPTNRNMSNIGEISRHLANKTKGEGPVLQKSYEKTVYYATDRNLTGQTEPDAFYGIQRTKDGELSYGICTVSVPESHLSGHMEEPFLGLDFLESTEDHFVLQKISPLKKEELFVRLKKTSDDQSDLANDIMIFIHGFNQSFEMAAKRTAQIAIDLNFKGAPFMYSWPSNDSLFDYWSDREDVIWSVAHLAQLLKDLRSKVPGRNLHLIAHSMGNQALIGALNRIALKTDQLEPPLFKSIILAAPDFDAVLFQEQMASDIVNLSANWSIYTSENDAALTYSGDINDSQRLGVPLPVIDGMNVIDASNIDVAPWSVPEFHSYYATKLIVIKDMANILKGLSPIKRGLIPRTDNPFLWLLKIPETAKKVLNNTPIEATDSK